MQVNGMFHFGIELEERPKRDGPSGDAPDKDGKRVGLREK